MRYSVITNPQGRIVAISGSRKEAQLGASLLANRTGKDYFIVTGDFQRTPKVGGAIKNALRKK